VRSQNDDDNAARRRQLRTDAKPKPTDFPAAVENFAGRIMLSGCGGAGMAMTRLAIIVMTVILLQGASPSPAAAGGFERDPPDAFVVCSVRRRCCCWLEPGTQYRFYRLFGPVRPLTESGALGLWQPVRIGRRHRH
jgi:hypothetical protein